MKFLGLLLGLVIFVAVLYQSVFTPAVNHQTTKSTHSIEPSGLQTLKQAQQLQQQLNNRAQKMDYTDRIKQQ